MENSLLVIAIVSIAATVYISQKIFQHRKQKLPPGPKPWPIIGNLDLIGPIAHQSLHTLSKTYGGIMQLKFGQVPVVVASSPEMAKLFLKTHDQLFANRPPLAAGKHMAYNYSNMLWAPYGPYWRQARKIYLTEMLSAKKLELHQHIRIEERCNFLSRIHALSGKPFVIRDHLLRFTLSNISRVIFGKSFSAEKIDEFQGILDKWVLLNGVFNIGDWIPWLGFLDLQGYVKNMKAMHKKLDTFLDYAIDSHQARKVEDELVPDSMLEAMLQMGKDPNLDAELELTRDRIKGLILDLLGGGVETSASTIEWAIVEIMKQPHIIKKAKEELDNIIGRKRWVEESDFSRLPYMEAIIKETLRLHPLATLLAPHYTIKDTNVEGYNISKGTVVLINAWSIGRDPKAWDSPEEFRPERFMEKEINILGKSFDMLPFGSGRRMCPGYELGLKFSQSMLANLLHGFTWKLPEDAVLSTEEEYGITTHPKVPLAIIMEPTLHIIPCE